MKRGASGAACARDTQIRRVGAATDAALVAAMRAGDPHAWAEFQSRFRAVLQTYARAYRVPEWEWDVCIEEVLCDEAIRFGTTDAAVPARMGGYLARAVRHRFLRLKRAAAVRERAYRDAAEEGSYGRIADRAEPVLRVSCSEAALRDGAGADAAERRGTSPGVRRLVEALVAGLTDPERQLLEWDAQLVPHRQIAEWIGESYDATTKRIWRLERRLRARAAQYVARLPADERRAVDRVLRRSGTVHTAEARRRPTRGASARDTATATNGAGAEEDRDDA